MLPNKLYEMLPFLYVITGILTLFLMPGSPVLTTLSGALLFIAGGLVWIARSDHRRMDINNKQRSNGPLPFWCYEFLPFGYILFALLLIVWSSNPMLYPSAVIFLVVGHQLWFLRANQRVHQKPSFVKAHH